MAEIGTGSTLAFATSGWTPEIIGINLPGITRESINTSHLGTTTAHTYMLTSLYDGGTLDLEIAWDPDEDPPIFAGSDMETLTLTFAGAGDPWTFSAGQIELGIAVPLEDKMTASCSFKISGPISRS